MSNCLLILFGLISQPAPAEPTPAGGKSAPELVREANELLLSDKPAEALDTYGRAQSLKPDAREIAFDQALAHYKLGDFDKAREAFSRAAAGTADELADDALYGLGNCDHAEAMAAEDPKEAVSKIESAMRNYQNVLGNQRDHAAARDANLKAASYWRQLKQQMQEQQQQPKPDSEGQPNNSPQQVQTKEVPEEQEKIDGAPEHEDTPQQDQANAEQEDTTKDQAERKLREMVQAMRDRKKHRREEPNSLIYRPTEKDW